MTADIPDHPLETPDDLERRETPRRSRYTKPLWQQDPTHDRPEDNDGSEGHGERKER